MLFINLFVKIGFQQPCWVTGYCRTGQMTEWRTDWLSSFSLVRPGRTRSGRSFCLRQEKKNGHIGSDRIWPMKKNAATVSHGAMESYIQRRCGVSAILQSTYVMVTLYRTPWVGSHSAKLGCPTNVCTFWQLDPVDADVCLTLHSSAPELCTTYQSDSIPVSPHHRRTYCVTKTIVLGDCRKEFMSTAVLSDTWVLRFKSGSTVILYSTQ